MPFSQPPLVRRKSSETRRPIFSFDDDDEDDDLRQNHRRSSSSSSDDNEPAPQSSSPPSAQSLTIAMVPFPTLSPISPVSRSADPSPSPPNSSLPRTTSTPIILSNGKPLKPSLKSSHSSPHIPQNALHLRSQSAPSTPSLQPKNVHFPDEKELSSVRLFRPAGRPLAVSTGAADETETETEGYDSATAPRGSYPFPSTSDSLIQLNTDVTSPVPNPNSSPYANVYLETLQLPRTRPRTLCGSVLVRNVTYSKTVAVRFTLDDWQTTSEVSCRYVASLPSLPPPFRQEMQRVGDAITSLSHASLSAWDRWSFQIRLEDVERRLAERTMFLAVRYIANGEGGGEWWDNNGGANYRISFRKEAVAPSAPSTAMSSMHARSSSTATLRPKVNISSNFPTRPPAAAPITPVSPKLSLRNYVSPVTTPPAEKVPVMASSPGLPSPPASRDGSPPKEPNSPLPSSPVHYAQLVKQWCFAGDSPGTPTTPKAEPQPERKFAPEWERFRHGGNAFNGRLTAMPSLSVGTEMA